MWAKYLFCFILISVVDSESDEPEKVDHKILDNMGFSPSAKEEVIEARNSCQESLKINPEDINEFEAKGNQEKPLSMGPYATCVFTNLKALNDKGEFDVIVIRQIFQGEILKVALSCILPNSIGSDAVMLDLYDCLIKPFRL